MNGASKNDRLIRFSVFELDLDSGELFKQGRKVKLQGQPFELLLALLERPGEVSTREELRQKVWPSEAAGDFDHGLNRAINKIREALGDSAENPRFIETLPRRGYRFIGSIERRNGIESDNPGPPQASAAVEPSDPISIEQPLESRRALWVGGALLASILITTAAILLLRHSTTVPIQLQQLTTNSLENPILHAVISPDGKYLAYGDLTGIQIQLIGTRESYTLPKPPALSSADLWLPQAWFPDGTHLLVSSDHSTPDEQIATAWSVSVVGGSAVPLRQGAVAQSISPDGSTIAFMTGGPSRDWMIADSNNIFFRAPDIWLMNSHGGAVRKIVAGGAGVLYIGSVRWSPHGKQIAYEEVRLAGDVVRDCFIKSVDENGGSPTVIVSYRQEGVLLNQPLDFAWLPDDRIVYAFGENSSSSQDTNLWQIKVDRRSGRPKGQPQRITNLVGFRMSGFSFRSDGRQLAFANTKEHSRIQLGRMDATGKLVETRVFTLDERDNVPWAFTADSKNLIFSSDRSGNWALYRQQLQANVPELIHTDPERVAVTRLSPNGAYLIYLVQLTGKHPQQVNSFRFMRAPVTGGSAAFLFQDDRTFDYSCPQNSGVRCLVDDVSADRKQQTFFSFDPVSGSRRQLFQITRSSLGLANEQISPDGSNIAMVRYDNRAHVEIRSLDGQIQKKFEVKGWSEAHSLDWAADGKALLVSSPGLIRSPSGPVGITLLRVDLEGNAQPIWESASSRATLGIPSRDGKYLAIWQPTVEGNVWCLEGF